MIYKSALVAVLLVVVAPCPSWADCGRLVIVPNEPGADSIQPIIINNNNNNNNNPINNTLIPGAMGGGTPGGGVAPGGDASGLLQQLLQKLGPILGGAVGGLALTDTQVPQPVGIPDITRPIPKTGNQPLTYAIYYNHFTNNKYFTEGRQEVVVAFNGEEEILILQTDDRSRFENTAMMSLLPLPGKPLEIALADKEAFAKASRLITDDLNKQAGQAGRDYGVSLTAKIGVHDFIAVEITNQDDADLGRRLQQWLDAYLSTRYGMDKAKVVITPQALQIIRTYRQKGFNHFVFDLVVVPKQGTAGLNDGKMPVLYRFRTKGAYYPLVVSKIGGVGKSLVRIALFSKGGLAVNTAPTFTLTKIGEFAFANVTSDQLEAVDPKVKTLFGDGQKLSGRILNIQGELESFDSDLYLVPPNE